MVTSEITKRRVNQAELLLERNVRQCQSDIELKILSKKVTNPNWSTAIPWVVWATMTIAAFAYVYRYGTNVPSWDDWDMIPVLTGNQKVTWDWLWSQHNEHRVPLPRLVMLAVTGPLGLDLRRSMYLDAALLSIVAAGLVLAAGHLRGGRGEWVDAFFPLLVLNLAQGLNFIWAWQVEFILSTTLATAVLVVITWRPFLSNKTALLLLVLLALLAMCGAHGVALLPAMGCYFIAVAGLRWYRQAGGGHSSSLAIPTACALLTFAMVGIYLIGYEPVPWHPKSPSLRASLTTSLQFLAMGFGPWVHNVWPAIALAIIALGGGTAALLGAVLYRRPGERERAVGLLCVLGGMGSLALAIGLGRDGWEPRYITLSVIAPAAVYLVWTLYRTFPWSRIGQLHATISLTLLLAVGVGLPPNTLFGLEYAQELSGALRSYQAGLAAGVPPRELWLTYQSYLHPHSDVVMDYLPMLKAAGVWPYAQMRDDPPLHEMPVSLEPAHTHEVIWDRFSRTAQILTRWESSLTFDLPGATKVAGVRMTFRYAPAPGSKPLPYVRIMWRKPGQQVAPPEQVYKISPTGDRANWRIGTFRRIGTDTVTMHAWIGSTIDQIKIQPNDVGQFTIEELTLLFPAE